MRIQRWTAHDALERRTALNNLLRAGLTGSVSATARSVELSIQETMTAATSGGSLTLAAERDGKLLGVLVALPRLEGASLFVLWLVVDPEHRRRGIGAALVRHLERLAGTKEVCGLVNRDDAVAAAFWPAVGYELPRRQTQRVRISRLLAEDAPCAS